MSEFRPKSAFISLFIKEYEVSYPKNLTTVPLKSKSLVQKPGSEPKLQVMYAQKLNKLKLRPKSSVLCSKWVTSPQSYVQVKSSVLISTGMFWIQSPQSYVQIKSKVLSPVPTDPPSRQCYFEVKTQVLGLVWIDTQVFSLMFESSPKSSLVRSNQVTNPVVLPKDLNVLSRTFKSCHKPYGVAQKWWANHIF